MNRHTLLKYCFKEVFYIRNFTCEFCAKRNIHQYRNSIPWKNTLEFSQYLIKTAVYNDHGLLVLNKPYGISFSRDVRCDGSTNESKPDPEDVVFKKPVKNQPNVMGNPYRTSGVNSESLNLVDCLPYLKQHFGYDKLHISRVPGKYTSGVAILTTSKELVERVNQTRNYPPTGKDKYFAVVVGVPRYKEGKVRLALQKKEQPNKGKRVYLLQKWSNTAFKRGEVRIGTFHFRLMSYGFNDLTSLVEVSVDLRKHHAYRVFLADYLLAPVLGDNMFGSRVQRLMGVPMSVDPFSDAANMNQKLPDELYEMLGLSPAQASLIPIHVHLAETVLPQFLPEKKSLMLRAPPPPHFLWTCEQLGLSPSDSDETTLAII